MMLIISLSTSKKKEDQKCIFNRSPPFRGKLWQFTGDKKNLITSKMRSVGFVPLEYSLLLLSVPFQMYFPLIRMQ